MPLNSAEIAAASGQFQSMYASNMQFSSMVGGMGGPPVQAERVTGGLMNAAASVGAPLASLGLGLAGLDPLSMGIKAGMAAYPGAGLMGAGVAGLGAAAGVAVPMAIASYGANQMWTGAQQQQAFNQQMRGAFGFMTPQGQGFTGSQMGAINQQLFNMTGQGPNGEMTGIRELQGLAANMGRMGLAGTGARDVQQFSQRFREMVDTLKTVAKEMGTSLQAAQEFVVSMRGSGIFNSGDQRRLATEIRQFAQAGNLATSELTAAANIGAQVSRAIGGRGSQGAFAGVRTIGSIGAAMQAGVLSEEDIYNATGLTGAEGRQAMATRQLEQAGGFLRSGRGRMFLASVAGQNGQLDPNSVQSWMEGGMGIGQTRGAAQGNLGRLGKAGFLRNEGRLRGAALQQFGGMLPTMALMQWAESKGIDVNQMDDRSMMFASRQLGMGMDELENAVKMARGMPAIAEQQRAAQEMATFQTRAAQRNRTQGIEGVQRRFEEARDKIQGSLQSAGAKFYTEMDEMVERYINKMTGVAVEEYDQRVAAAHRAAMSGAGTQDLARELGLGGGRARAGMGAAGPLTGGTGGAGLFYNRGLLGTRGAAMATGGLSSLLAGPSEYEQMQKAGYGGLFREGMSADQLRQSGMAAQGAYLATQGAMLSAEVTGAHGEARVAALTNVLRAKAEAGDKNAQAALRNIQAGKSSEEQMEIATKMMYGKAPGEVGGLSRGFATVGERHEAYGAALGVAEKPWRTGLAGSMPIVRVDAGASTTDKLLLGAGLGFLVRKTGQRDVGEYLSSGEGKDLVRGVYSGDQKALDSLNDMLLDPNITGTKKEALRRLGAASDMAAAEERAQKEGRTVSEAEVVAIAKKRGLASAAEVRTARDGVGAIGATEANKARQQLIRDISRDAMDRSRSYQFSGVASTTKEGGMALSAGVQEALRKAGGKGAETVIGALSKQIAATQAQTGFGEQTSGQTILDVAGEFGRAEQQLAGMSVAEQRKYGRALTAAGYGDMGTHLQSMANKQAVMERRLAKGGGAYAVGGMLGVKFKGGADLKGVQTLLGKDSAAAAGVLLQRAGIEKDFSDEERAQLGEIMAGTGMYADKGKRQTALQSLQAGTDPLGRKLQEGVHKVQAKQSEDDQRQKDPLLSKVEEHLNELRRQLSAEGPVGQAMVNTGKAMPALIRNTDQKNDTEDSSSPAPQPGKK